MCIHVLSVLRCILFQPYRMEYETFTCIHAISYSIDVQRIASPLPLHLDYICSTVHVSEKFLIHRREILIAIFYHKYWPTLFVCILVVLESNRITMRHKLDSTGYRSLFFCVFLASHFLKWAVRMGFCGIEGKSNNYQPVAIGCYFSALCKIKISR
jgi:hypothetical protein